jgi:hypothetical protein
MLGYEQMILMGIDGNYVEKIDEAKARGKDVLEILKTPERNPNYFFAGYQVEGDRYTVPNPIPNLHIDCWRAASNILAENNIIVWNGSANSRVDFFPFRSFADVESDRGSGVVPETSVGTGAPAILELERTANAHVDEAAVIASLFADRRGERHVLPRAGPRPPSASLAGAFSTQRPALFATSRRTTNLPPSMF